MLERSKPIPSRLAKARKTLDMTQAQFAANIRENLPSDRTVSTIMVSSWETARRDCKPYIVKIIAKLSGFPEDYFYGLCDENGNEETYKYVDDIDGAEIITRDSLYLYDLKPVYVEFLEHQHVDSWALVNMGSNELVFTENVLKLNARTLSQIRLRRHKPYYAFTQEELAIKKLDLGSVFSSKRVYVVMICSDAAIRAKYNGWYSHNGDHSALQNHIGLVLSYDGLGISYNAYPDTIHKEEAY